VLQLSSQEIEKRIQEQKESSLAETAEGEKLKVTITSPRQDTYAGGVIEIKADISCPPDVKVDRVEFYADKKLLYTDKRAPYKIRWNTGKEFNRRLIEVVAYDSEEKKASDALAIVNLKGFRLKKRVELVNLDVTVTDEYGKYVKGLEKDDFLVYEDGREQAISHFSEFERPLAVGILIDTSGSMR